MGLYSTLYDRVLTRVDAERAHAAAVRGLAIAQRVPGAGAAARRVAVGDDLAVEAMGLRFPNPIGVAAGLDKNGMAVGALAATGFGFVEVGTVTGQEQPGNPRPRLFRLGRDQAVLNRMGFNNDGAAQVAARLAAWRRTYDGPPVVLGVNVGKTKVVPESEAVADYQLSTRLLAPYADYLVVNVSSPNTPGLRDLQAVDKLGPLLEAVRRQADAVTTSSVPLLVKIAPDLTDDDVRAVGDLALELGLDGVVATNTTIARDGLVTDPATVERLGAGGISGRPVAARSLEVLRLLRAHVGDDLTIVSVGGVWTPDDVLERLTAGATLVQAYTTFVYHGAMWPRQVVKFLRERWCR